MDVEMNVNRSKATIFKLREDIYNIVEWEIRIKEMGSETVSLSVIVLILQNHKISKCYGYRTIHLQEQ